MKTQNTSDCAKAYRVLARQMAPKMGDLRIMAQIEGFKVRNFRALKDVTLGKL